MWVITGVLLGLVVLGTLIGLHTGPHGHVAAGALGLVVGVLLLVLAIERSATTLLWVLIAGDLTLSAGLGLLAWRGLANRQRFAADHRALVPTGAEGVAVSDLDPEGIVKVQGEDWSAVAINSPVPSGTPVQVVRRGGVRLEVWGQELPLLRSPDSVGPSKEG
jgi:membrane-bound ClpP family serine protease